MINRIGQLDPIQPGKKPGRNDPVGGNDRTDSITLSPEAKEKAEMIQVVELIKSAPDIDELRIAELRQKINDPSYLNERVINATAEKIMAAFGV
ncbi:MAG: flagellar biosynthesis anti-sigma factor FlgM [Treponema sp.]|nr:flagellar biosynthesis anti-sigma factor FlgM [Treponema sp.]